MLASDKDKTRVNLPMPYGWFHVLYSHELEVGQSKPLNYFDQELVAFRTESGVAKVVDAYCPHMGAHLGYGVRSHSGTGAAVVGESIVCPFHGWQYNGEGQCTKIPYSAKVPPRIQRGEQVLGSWQVREMNQTIMVWYHPEGIAPLFEPELIPEAAADNDAWTAPHIVSRDIYTHMQEIGENAVDAAHFHFVHGTDEIPEVAAQVFDGHSMHGSLSTRQPTPRGVVDANIENRSVGPGLSHVWFTGICDTLLLASLTPVTKTHTRANYAYIQKKEALAGGNAKLGAALLANLDRQQAEDIIIWNRKKHYKRPLLCNADGAFMQFRRWYSQFLVE
ncbi:MAG: Rieske 2Fe-2S domain-containing protein [Gammaproteobacteria bacterium]|nr:Rieske 2Fe-2S domain-containing protein [Gammaproteobacteria bacterium]NNM11323.1 Rieske 2Fe-2S domain-containing protein [Pseudomonadales bacterium]RZV52064.1 MAG: aromatic ring-hydroxylating dioxygenase subunit alpha [Pseudomonadales bacterium]